MSKTEKQPKKGPGRPKGDPAKKRGEWIGAAVTTLEKRAFLRKAEDMGLRESVYLRDLCGFERRPEDAPKKTT